MEEKNSQEKSLIECQSDSMSVLFGEINDRSDVLIRVVLFDDDDEVEIEDELESNLNCRLS